MFHSRERGRPAHARSGQDARAPRPLYPQSTSRERGRPVRAKSGQDARAFRPLHPQSRIFFAERSWGHGVPCAVVEPIMEERTQGILLQSRVMGEADLLVQFFTEDFGRLPLKAQGAKRSKKRFYGLLESFSHHHLALEPRRTGWPLLLRLEPIEMHTALRHNLGAFAAASYAAELLLQLTQEQDVNRPLFGLLSTFLHYCTDHPITPKVLARFTLRLLHDLGLQPDWNTCMECGRPYTQEQSFRFDLAQGGMLCSACLALITRISHCLPLPPPTQRLLQGLQQKQSFSSQEALPWSEALYLLNQRINHLLGHRPRSRNFLYDMNPELPPDSKD